ncbi:MAG: hypothetical protein C0418_05700 [Coriobacteriaceae bacterium]|nr:hypothetical protein [Coriobacteriaceae bacterium]
MHLEDGEPVCRKRGKVAYGGRNWELFRRLDKHRDELGVEKIDVFIYASQTREREHFVSWHACYIGHVEGIGGAHPHGPKFRPPSTLDDGTGYWAVFWEVTDLERIAPIQISELRGLDAKKDYDKSFVPEGPILIENPW